MPNENQTNRLSVSTQIRNFYNQGEACLNLKFYNNLLSVAIYPFTGKDQNDRDQYDSAQGLTTTMNYENAFALYNLANNILSGQVNQCVFTIPCMGATIVFERKPGPSGMQTSITIDKNGVNRKFTFSTVEYQSTENGMNSIHTIESTLGAFAKTIEGYLTGINASLHLNKLTEDYSKMHQNNQQPYNNYRNNNNNNYQRRPYNNNNYRNNNSNYRNNNYQNQPVQSLNDYQIQG